MLRKASFSAMLLFFCTPAFSQENDTSALKYSKIITAAGLKKHLSILASDEYEGRETGKRGQKISAEYIAEQFKTFGIPPYKEKKYYQEYPITISKPKGAEITINNKKFEFLKDFYCFSFGSEEGVKNAKVIFLG